MSEVDHRWRARLAELGDEPAEEALGSVMGEMVHEATAPGRAAVQTWRDPNRAPLGRRLLAGLDFTALLAGLYAETHPDPTSRAWFLTQLVESEVHLRGQLAARLQEALCDQERLHLPEPPAPIEQAVPQRRVCDEAYLLLRQLCHPEEDRVGFSVERDAYLQMPEEKRDELIERALQQKTWNLSPFDLPP